MAKTQYSTLKNLIKELENELDLVDSPEHHSTIEKLKADLQALKEQTKEENLSSLFKDEESKDEESSPFLKASINFEESHPKLATTLNDIAYLLNNIGI